MEIEDFAEPEIAVTAAITAALFSPRARKVMRKGLVYGMAGVLAAGDIVTSFAKSVGQGVQQAGEVAVQEARKTVEQASEKAETETSEKAETAPAPRRKPATKAETAKATAGAGGRSA